MTDREYEEMIRERDAFIVELQAEIARLKAQGENLEHELQHGQYEHNAWRCGCEYHRQGAFG